LPTLPLPSGPPLDLATWTQALLALPRSGNGAPWISLRMHDALQRPDVQALAPRLRLAGTPTVALRQLGRWAAQAYADTGNFTFLHALTGTRALTRLLPRIPPEHHEAVVPAFTRQLAAALLASRWQGEALPALPVRSWDSLREAATAHEDDHAIKAVHAAWDLGQALHDDPDPVWQQAAARALASFPVEMQASHPINSQKQLSI
jgi:hypothetical protein